MNQENLTKKFTIKLLHYYNQIIHSFAAQQRHLQKCFRSSLTEPHLCCLHSLQLAKPQLATPYFYFFQFSHTWAVLGWNWKVSWIPATMIAIFQSNPLFFCFVCLISIKSNLWSNFWEVEPCCGLKQDLGVSLKYALTNLSLSSNRCLDI